MSMEDAAGNSLSSCTSAGCACRNLQPDKRAAEISVRSAKLLDLLVDVRDQELSHPIVGASLR
jgi:hypothetical protein